MEMHIYCDVYWCKHYDEKTKMCGRTVKAEGTELHYISIGHDMKCQDFERNGDEIGYAD